MREAADVLTVLPEPGTALHALMTGRYDLTDLIECLLGKLGPARLTIATLSFNQRNAQQFEEWLASGKILSLDLLSSSFHKEHNGELFRAFKETLHKYNGRLAAIRNHAKICCLEFTGSERYVAETSANCRSNGNREQVTLIRDDGLFRFHHGWITEQITIHEGDPCPG